MALRFLTAIVAKLSVSGEFVIVKYWRAFRYALIRAWSLSTIQPILKPLKLNAFDRSPKTVALGKRDVDAVALP
jgi:hypothetical protein